MAWYEKFVMDFRQYERSVRSSVDATSFLLPCRYNKFQCQYDFRIEEQAISRAYRMGQSRNVVVYRLLTENSIDVSMLEVLGQKAGLFDLYARDCEVGSLALNEHSEDESLKQQVLKIEKEGLASNVG